jgi:hypothetical protein
MRIEISDEGIHSYVLTREMMDDIAEVHKDHPAYIEGNWYKTHAHFPPSMWNVLVRYLDATYGLRLVRFDEILDPIVKHQLVYFEGNPVLYSDRISYRIMK